MMGSLSVAGSAISFGGPVAQAYGWRTAMVIAARAGIVLLPALFLLRRTATRRQRTRKARRWRTTSIWNVLRIPTLWWIIVSGALLNFNALCAGPLLSRHFSAAFTASPSANSGKVDTGIALSSWRGERRFAFAGYLGDYISHRRKDGRLALRRGHGSRQRCRLACIGILQPAHSLYHGYVFLGVMYASLSTYYGLRLLRHSGHRRAQPARFRYGHLLSWPCTCAERPSARCFTGKLSDVLAHRAAALAGSPSVTEAFRAIGLQQAMLDHSGSLHRARVCTVHGLAHHHRGHREARICRSRRNRRRVLALTDGICQQLEYPDKM